MSAAEARATAVADAMADIREIDARGIDREGVEAIRERLLQLAARRDLFPAEDFPAPRDVDDAKSCLYRLAQDPDDRFALYAQACRGGVRTPAHDHTTWAVIVGFDGSEVNTRYRGEAGAGAPEPVGQVIVERDTGIAFLPDEVHSIQVDGPALNFHCYGRALERLDHRRYWHPDDQEWRVFPAHSDIREARLGAR